MEDRIDELEKILASIFLAINVLFGLIIALLAGLAYAIFDILDINYKIHVANTDHIDRLITIVSKLDQKSSEIVNVTDTVEALKQGQTTSFFMICVLLTIAVPAILYLYINIGKKMKEAKKGR